MDITLMDRIKSIFSVIASQSFFVTLFIILVMTTSLLLINIKAKSKAPKYVATIVYVGLTILVLARYGSYVLSLNDSVVEKFFKAVYFPNFVVYVSMLIVTLILITITIIDEKFSIVAKVCNSMCFFIIWFLFVLVVDLIKEKGLNFAEVKDIYSDFSITILLQASMYVFVVWFGVILMDLIVRRISNKMDENDLKHGKPLKPPAKIIDFSAFKKNKSNLLDKKPLSVDEKEKTDSDGKKEEDSKEKEKDKKDKDKKEDSESKKREKVKKIKSDSKSSDNEKDKKEEKPASEEVKEESASEKPLDAGEVKPEEEVSVQDEQESKEEPALETEKSEAVPVEDVKVETEAEVAVDEPVSEESKDDSIKEVEVSESKPETSVESPEVQVKEEPAEVKAETPAENSEVQTKTEVKPEVPVEKPEVVAKETEIPTEKPKEEGAHHVSIISSDPSSKIGSVKMSEIAAAIMDDDLPTLDESQSNLGTPNSEEPVQKPEEISEEDVNYNE